MRPAGPSVARYLARWGLTADGDPIVTHAADLLPVRRHGEAAMLRIATSHEAKGGDVLMTWWNGDGAARVLAAEGDVLLLERAEGHRSLSDYARNGRDDEATAILCDVIARLHAPRAKPLPDLIPLATFFEALEPAAAAHGGVLVRSVAAARSLLSNPQDVGVLHGDLHHDNVLDFGDRGWLAIDPNRLIGERSFDYANLFCNPDLEDPSRPVATLPGRFARRLEIVVARSGLDRARLLQWIVAWTGLSAAWFLGDGDSPEIDLRLAALAIAEIDR